MRRALRNMRQRAPHFASGADRFCGRAVIGDRVIRAVVFCRIGRGSAGSDEADIKFFGMAVF